MRRCLGAAAEQAIVVGRAAERCPVGARSGAATSTRDGLEVVQCVTCAAVSERPLSRRSSLAAPQSVVTSIQEQEQEQHKGEGVAERKASGEMKWGNAHEALYTIVRERSLSHDTASVERSRRGLSIADEGDLLADSAVTRSPLQGPVGARSGAATSTRDGLEVVQCVTCAAVSERPLSRRSSLAAPQSVVTSIQEQEQEQHKGEGVAERKASGEMKWGNAHEALYTIVRERSLSHDTASVERSRRGLSIADEVGDFCSSGSVV
ncbi:hypothetical protein LSM04_004427 [Trypanosoma melophagium]|uniref:uncharacterized protein n=1 Tax=Trypanosoma melophagium TaxID=715481 RepID=UPI003519ED72|nr:hypothetical protein LSM04_004427 [Trypanosoma melophagium]